MWLFEQYGGYLVITLIIVLLILLYIRKENIKKQ